MKLRGLALLTVMAIASIAMADLGSDVVFSVQACVGEICTDFYEVTVEDGTWEGDTFTWELDGIVEFHDGEGNVFATLGSDVFPTFTVIAMDPQVNLGFAMQAGSADTTFTIRSALLEFGTMLNPQAQASVGVNVSDVMGDGATLVGAGPDDRVYLAQYNQFVPDGTTFTTLIDGVIVTEPFDTVSVDDETGWQSIAGSVNNMSSQIKLTLSAFDMASGTSNFEIIPEPASLLMLVLGAALARRR